MDVKMNFTNWTTANSSEDTLMPESANSLYQISGLMGVSIVFSIVTIILVTPLHLGLIFFEKFGSDKKRTLVNKLQSSICWYVIIWNFSIQAITIYIFSGGPVSGNSSYNSLKLSPLKMIQKYLTRYFIFYTTSF